MLRPLAPLMLLAALALAGCERLGIETPELQAQRKEAEGKAIGAACRHAARAIEDCYALNKKADKAAMFAGWREMNDYMRENQIEPVAPQLAHAEPPAKAASAAEEGGEGAADKHGDAHADKADKPAKGRKGEKSDA